MIVGLKIKNEIYLKIESLVFFTLAIFSMGMFVLNIYIGIKYMKLDIPCMNNFFEYNLSIVLSYFFAFFSVLYIFDSIVGYYYFYISKLAFYIWTAYNLFALSGNDLLECKTNYSIVYYQVFIEFLTGTLFMAYFILYTIGKCLNKNKYIDFYTYYESNNYNTFV
jgi:hypothetical protein